MIKVEHTKTHRLAGIHPASKEYLSVLVTDTELIFVDVPKSRMCKTIFSDGIGNRINIAPNDDAFIFFKDKEQTIQPFKPILISRTEKIEDGDWYYDTETKTIKQAGDLFTNDDVSILGKRRCYKILTLPEHFSPQQLQDIASGKLREGKCLVECENIDIKTNWETDEMFKERHLKSPINQIKLNPHITIYNDEEKVYPEKFVNWLIGKQDAERMYQKYLQEIKD